MVDEVWAKMLGALACAAQAPSQTVVLVANATGIPSVTKLVVGAMRGGDWNVATSIDEPSRSSSEIVGASAAAARLAKIFSTFAHRAGRATIVRLGVDARPNV